jgi:hypothetical protein
MTQLVIFDHFRGSADVGFSRMTTAKADQGGFGANLRFRFAKYVANQAGLAESPGGHLR